MAELSVVIPTYRRPGPLRRVLDLLGEQTVAAETFEVLVVMDERDDDRATVAAAVGERPYPARLLARHRPGVAAARNRGWREAVAPLVLFLGDDILPAGDLLEQHLEWHRREAGEEVGVLGRVDWAGELSRTPFMRWLERGFQFDYGSIRGDQADWWHFYTSNASVNRSLLERVDGFDESFPFCYEDLDLGKRMHEEAGFRLLYNERARAEHLHATSLDEWRARVAMIAPAERRFVRKHPGLTPYFLGRFRQAAKAPPVRGRGVPLIRFLPTWTPLIGERAWASADLYFRQALASDFLAAWEGESEARPPSDGSDPPAGLEREAASPGGSSPSGP